MRIAVQSLALLVVLTAPGWAQGPAATPDSQAIPASYTITPIGDPGNEYNVATAISSNGIVAGTAGLLGLNNPFVYQNGTFTQLSNTNQNYAAGVNSSAQVVSTLFDEETSQALLYVDGHAKIIPVPNSEASGINDWGCVVGHSTANKYLAPPWTAFLYCKGTVVTLPSLPSCPTGSTFAQAINASGEIVGSSDTTAACLQHAFLLKNGVMKDLGTLGGNNSSATAISTNGLITGSSTASGDAYHAFLYKGNKMKDLGTLPGCVSSFGTGVNKHGTVVGYCDDLNPDTPEVAMVYDGKKLVDLNTLIPSGSGWHLMAAYAINDRGQIVGAAIDLTKSPGYYGYYMGFLLTPIAKKP